MSAQTTQKSPGRNDPCPCGSGKKYKKCCGSLKASYSEPSNISSIQEATGLFQKGRYLEATNICLRLLGQNETDSAANNLYGLLQYRQGNVQLAIKHLEIALTGDPGNALIYSNLCHMSEVIGQLDEAKEYCMRAISLNPKLADAYNNLGNILISNDDLIDDALDHYYKAHELAPTNLNYLMNVAVALYKKGDLEEAEKIYLKAIRLNPQWVEPLKNLASLMYAQGKFEQAKKYLNKALSINNNDQETLLNLSSVSKLVGDAQMAEAYLLDIENIQPGQTHIQLELASVYQRFGWLDKMEQACRRAAALDPGNPGIYETWAKYEEGRHQLDRAEELLEKAVSLGFPTHNLLSARIARRRKNWQQAMFELQKIDPEKLEGEDQYKFFYDKGYVLDKLGDFDAAWDAFSAGAKKRIQIDKVIFNSSEQQIYMDRMLAYFSKTRLDRFGKLAANQSLPVGSAKPIFIVGFPRSGTTLIEQMLCSHPKISAGDELPYIREIGLKFCEDTNKNVPWPECLDEYSESELTERLGEMRQFYIGQVSNLRVVDMQRDYFTDKMPLNLVSLPLIHLLFPNSPIIHIVRNPIDSCISNFFSCFGNSNQHALNIENAAEYFRMTFEYACNICERIDGLNYLQIRYEDLVTDTERNLRKVIEFIGVPWDDACLDFKSSKRISRTISYDQVTQGIYRSSVERYRHYQKHLAKVFNILRPILQQCGYPVQ